MANIVVIGAGVSGLTTALRLAQKSPDYNITIVAKHMPGDYDIEYTSPWAGANYLPMADEENSKYERETWPELARLATDVPEAGVHFQNTIIHNRAHDPPSYSGPLRSELTSPDPWFRSLLPNFRILPPSSLPPGITSATAFTAVCINLPIYLSWLVSRCVAHGIVLRRAVLSHIRDAATLHASGQKADLVVNCSGLLARFLGGVEDIDVVPARGVTILVRNDPGVMTTISGTDDGPGQVTYIMKRALGGGTILGGTYQMGNWDSQVHPDEALQIMKRCVKLCPQLTGGKGIENLSVVSYRVGLRPVRGKGVRVEREVVDGLKVVHNYGHAGWGYQGSYGCADEVERLVRESLGVKARL